MSADKPNTDKLREYDMRWDKVFCATVFITDTKPVSENRRLIPAKTRMIASTEYRKAKEAIKAEFATQGPEKPRSGPVEVLITARTGRADLTAWTKMLCDCLNGVAYDDDKQIGWLTIIRDDNKSATLVHIEVDPMFIMD